MPEYFDGVELPTTVIDRDQVIADHRGPVAVVAGAAVVVLHLQGSLRLAAGCSAKIEGTHAGSLQVPSGSSAHITGTQQGSVRVGDGAHVTIDGRHQGSIHVDRGGVVISAGEVAPKGRSTSTAR